MIISIDAEKAFDKIQHPFIIKTLNKMDTEGKYLKMMKTMYDKTSLNVIINIENLKLFILYSGTRQSCPHHYCFST